MERHPNLNVSQQGKSVDFVLVYQLSLLNEENLLKLEYYLENLLRTGLELKTDAFSVNKDVVFIRIHAPKDTILYYSHVCDIDLAFRSKDYRPPLRTGVHFISTPVTSLYEDNPLYGRAPSWIFADRRTDITSCERIMIVDSILNRTKFGPNHYDYGLEKLLNDKVLIDAFPLHDGSYEWTKTGPLTERQLLAKYWGTAKYWYKEQPLQVVANYFGPEAGFYYAWVGYYARMLVPAAVLSLLCLFYGLLTLNTDQDIRSEEICNSDLIMCPRCHLNRCKFETLKNACNHAHVTYMFDNPVTMAFAILISIWSTVFMEQWQRNESVLQLQFNIRNFEYDTTPRAAYVKATDSIESHLPLRVKFAMYIFTIMSVCLLLGIMLLATFAVMIYRTTMNLMLMDNSNEDIIHKHSHVIASITGSVMSACFMVIFKKIYGRFAKMLTDLEYHRTQRDFDNSFVYKNYALAFTNQYAPAFYIAFFKGRFFTHPGDMDLYDKFGGLGSDVCGPVGCIMDLGILISIILLVQRFAIIILQIVKPYIAGLQRRQKSHVTTSKSLPFYEQEYLMAATERNYLVSEYMDLVIQYGFVVLFIAAFPVVPVLALLNNMVELRVDASKMIRNYKRPIPRRVGGLDAWFNILHALTYMGVVTNGLVIAFTSDFVPKEIYRHKVDSSLKGFANSTLSVFDVSHFDLLDSTQSNRSRPKFCYYPGRRYPPGHEHQYEYTKHHWFAVAMRFLTVVVFEHLMILTKGITAYAIPDVPYYVTEALMEEEKENREARMKVAHRKFLEDRSEHVNDTKPLDIDGY